MEHEGTNDILQLSAAVAAGTGLTVVEASQRYIVRSGRRDRGSAAAHVLCASKSTQIGLKPSLDAARRIQFLRNCRISMMD
jgi:hypothetical protein